MGIETHDADRADVLALQAGEDLALNRLMARHRQRVFHFLTRLLQDEAEALDLAQETFVRLYLNKHKLNAEERLTSWLYTVAGNLAKDRLKKLSRRRTISLETPSGAAPQKTIAQTVAAPKPSPDAELQQLERAEAVKQALRELPEDLRTPLVLSEYEQLSQQEIAGILKCTRKAVENRMYRARKLLREKLEPLLAAHA